MHKLHLPRLGQTMERGIILRWLKGEGEPFAVGEPLYEVEAEKATTAIEAKLPGTLVRRVAKEGEELPVGALLGIVADPGESLSEAAVEAAIAEEQAELPAPAAAGPGTAATAAAALPAGRMRVLPRARVLAQELGIDLALVKGTGPQGAITVADVQGAAAAAGGSRVRERRPLRGIGRTMAEVVTRSWQQVPQFVQMALLDATALIARRQAEAAAIKRRYDVDLSYTDLILEAVVRSAREVPEANASFAGEEIVLYEDVNVAVAVAGDAGLVVPVIHRAQELSLADLARQLRALAERARAGALARADVVGGTITVSNLGMYGVETGVPLVTMPQAAVVFVGAIAPRPLVIGGALEPRPSFHVAVGFDHRVFDGATAARFMATLRRHLEAP